MRNFTFAKNATLTIICTLLFVHCASADIDPNDWIWGVKSQEQPSFPPATLFRFQQESTFVSLGIVTLNNTQIDVDGLAIDSQFNLYGFSVNATGTASQLLSIDKSTAQATAIGPVLSNRDIRGAVFDHLGRLIVIDSTQDQLLEINPDTGEVVKVLFELPDFSNLVDITQQLDGTFMIINIDKIYRLFLIHGISGVLTEYYEDADTGQDGRVPQMVGLAVLPTGNDPEVIYMYDVAQDDDIYTYTYTYDPSARFLRDDLILNLIPAYNAGRGDLAAAPLTLYDKYPMTQWSTQDGGNDHYYQTVRVVGGLNWSEARDVANDRQGYLATIHSQEENDFCYNLLNDPVLWYFDLYHSGIGPWLGGYEFGEGTWYWVTSELWSFWAWASGEPNNLGGNEAFLHFFSNTGSLMNNTWNDIGNNIMIHGFLIEWQTPEPPYDLVDFAHFASNWKMSDSNLKWSPVWDFDGNGNIGLDDLVDFASNWLE